MSSKYFILKFRDIKKAQTFLYFYNFGSAAKNLVESSDYRKM